MRLTLDDSTAAVPERWVDVLWQQGTEVGGSKPERVAFTSAQRGFDSLLTHWSGRIADLQSAVHLLQASWDSGGYLEADVLSLATAVEAYSSSFQLGQKLDDEGHEELVAAACAACPTEFHRPLRSILSNFNKPSLNSRIAAVAGMLPKAVARRLLPNTRAWSKQLYATRNQLSHSGRTDLAVVAHEVGDVRGVMKG